ncbi:MAG: xanthine dehydrogenase family protein molybdopterin-binding subunit [Anaerolineae bacterium]
MSKYVGKPIPRYDGLGHVTATTTYVDDVRLPGMLHVKVLRSPVHKANILNLDVSAAERLPGVKGVLTAEDVPNNAYGMFGDHPVLADTEVRYRGQPIAAVAAVDDDTALEALDLITLDLEELTPVLDPEEAMEPDAPKVRPEGNLWEFNSGPFRKMRMGDVEKGFAEADHLVEGTYTTPMQDHSPMETQCSVATVDGSDRLVIYTVSQDLYYHMTQLVGILQMPMNKVKYVGGTIGGGFGSKNDIHADHVTALLALKTRKPVKWRWTREEEMLYSTKRGRWKFYFKDGVNKDGRIIARYVRTMIDTGAYSGMGPYAIDKNALLVAGPFYIPNVSVDGYCVYTNKVPASSMRGFAILPGSATEQIQMDRIAETIGMDPWEIRFINAWRDGDRTVSGKVVDSVGLIEAMKAAAESAGVELPDQLKAMSSRERR